MKTSKHRSSPACILLMTLLLVPGCQHHYFTIKKKVMFDSIHRTQIPKHNAENVCISIWVHGTHFFPHVPSENKMGLRPITDFPSTHYLYIAGQAIADGQPSSLSRNNVYVFAWSGKLNAHLREQAAVQLYKELRALINTYITQYNRQPFIQIITHSHGGNVVLNLTKIHTDHADIPLIIDELILMACPVQTNTMHSVGNPMFKKIYALYSSRDLVQVIAPQLKHTKKKSGEDGINFPPFSQRRFPDYPQLTQVKLKINGRSLGHHSFVQPAFLRMLPQILHTIDAWKSELPPLPANYQSMQQILCINKNSRTITHYN